IVARMEAQKRIDLSLNIANKLIQKHKNIFFLYFGDGPLEYEMSTLAYKLGINKNVKFMGFVPNVKYYIKYFDVILFTSDWEGLPLALWEAMASGTPIVSTDVGGINEIIGKENCGIIFPQNSVQEGTISIEKVLFHNELKKKLSQNALLAMESKYSLPSFIKTMESFYNEI
ncbi:MAG: glycosyltransferase, partial [Ignavibacteriaceae bacterium]